MVPVQVYFWRVNIDPFVDFALRYYSQGSLHGAVDEGGSFVRLADETAMDV